MTDQPAAQPCSLPSRSSQSRNALNALLAGVILALVLTGIYWDAWRRLLIREEPVFVTFREDFDGQLSGNVPGMNATGDWQWGQGALMLPQGRPQSQGRIQFEVNVPPDASDVFLRLWMQGARSMGQGNHYRIVARSRQESPDGSPTPGHELFLLEDSRTLGGPGRLWRGEALTFKPPAGGGPVVVSLDYTRVAQTPSGPLPILQRIETGYILESSRVAPPLPLMFMICVSVVWVVILWRERFQWRAYIFPILTTAVLVFGAWLRWDWFIQSIGQPLSPDGRGFLEIIRTMASPYDTASSIAPWVREPFFPWLGWLWFRLTPDTANALRLLTMLMSVGAIWVAFEAGRRIIHPFAGFAAALFMAFNDYLIWSASRGLREEVYTILTLWLVTLFFALWKKPGGGAPDAADHQASCAPCGPCLWKWFALVSALIVLTRITSLAFVLPMIAVLCAARRMLPRHAVLTVLIIAIPLLPHLMFNYHYSEERDPFFSANVHAQFYRNLEFGGQPGFPSQAEIAADPYAGDPISSAGYIFGLHSPAQWVALPARGLADILATGFAYKISFSAHKLLLLLYALSFFLAFTRRRWWGVGMIVLLLAAPMAFVVGAGPADPRLLVSFMPFHYYILAIGLLRMREAIEYALQRNGRRRD